MEKSSVRTIDRLVEILSCFTRDKTSWSLSELSVRLELPKSTLHRFLVGLEAHGIVRRGDEDGRWRLGHRLFVWGSLAAESTGLRQVAVPIMRELADKTGETILLTEYHHREVVCIEKIETSHSVRLALDIGAIRSPHAGASSKVLMAHLPDAEVHAIIREKGLPRLCDRTITDPDELQDELRCIRERGYAESYEETDVGAWGIATPIRDWRGEVVAALGVAGPTVRFSQHQVEEYAHLCCEAAGRLSALLGSNSAPPVHVAASDELERRLNGRRIR
jgi:IclR family KDG regulon transcriptional repressor